MVQQLGGNGPTPSVGPVVVAQVVLVDPVAGQYQLQIGPMVSDQLAFCLMGVHLFGQMAGQLRAAEQQQSSGIVVPGKGLVVRPKGRSS